MTRETFKHIQVKPGQAVRLTVGNVSVGAVEVSGYFRSLSGELLTLDDDRYVHRADPIYVQLRSTCSSATCWFCAPEGEGRGSP